MPYPFQIFQSEQSLLFVYEYAGATRNILFNDPGPAPVDSWMGQSVGRWDGDTLVVESRRMNDETWFDRAGNFHSDQLQRGRALHADRPEHDALRSHDRRSARSSRGRGTSRMTLYRRVGEDARLQQFKCVEFVEELMYGHLRKEPLE